MRWNCPDGSAHSLLNGNQPIEWNCNDVFDPAAVLVNISLGTGAKSPDNNFQPDFGSPEGPTNPGLLGHNDWAAIDFSGGGSIGAGDSLPQPDETAFVELDLPTAQAIKAPPPTGLVARGGRRSVRLRWVPMGSLGDFTYNVYRSEAGGAPALIGTTPSSGFADRTAARGTLYTYQIAVVDLVSGESALSTGVTAKAR